MKKKKLLKQIKELTGMNSLGVKSSDDKKLQELRSVLDTDAVFKVTKDNTVQASLPVGDSTEFQRRIFFIMSAFLKQLSTSGLVNPEELTSRAIREGLMAADLSHDHEDLDDDLEEPKDPKKKYQ
jgi:hypothetical protein